MLKKVFIVSVLIALAVNILSAQSAFDCQAVAADRGIDIMLNEDRPLSWRYSASAWADGAKIIFCPAGIERSSPDDIKKRWSFDWKVKYNNIYIRRSDGLVIEGMNEHGLSASLMYLEGSMLLRKEKKLIPIAASLAVNFFIDHFKSIDTALLAVWDTRIFDDAGAGCGWPFRVILHDSTGATVYVEHIGGDLRVFTPEAPAVAASASDYSRLLTIRHTPLYEPKKTSEKDFIYFDHFAEDPRPKSADKIPAYYKKQEKLPESYFFIQREHGKPGLIVESLTGKASYRFSEIHFTPGREVDRLLY